MTIAAHLSRLVPDAVIARLLPADRRFDPSLPGPTVSFDAAARRRVLIGPVNSAGQAAAWARALRERCPDTDAVSLAVARSGGFAHDADVLVPHPVFAWSGHWQRSMRRTVESDVSHVLVESARSPFAGGLRADLDRDLAWLRGRGIGAALIWHGSDIRDAQRHAVDELSPYRDAEWSARAELAAQSARHRALAAHSGLPSLVSTPDLLDDVPSAVWLPVVVDMSRWASTLPVLDHEGPLRVVHAPSNALVKGTALIEPILHRLQREGIIDYRRLESTDHASMPARIAEADVVLDQFRLGSYGVAAVEALAAGRIVVGRLHDVVRERVLAAVGVEVPIVSSAPRDLESTLRDLASDHEMARSIAERGPAFARAVHDGAMAATVVARVMGFGRAAE